MKNLANSNTKEVYIKHKKGNIISKDFLLINNKFYNTIN